jgi:hypothetical protein
MSSEEANPAVSTSETKQETDSSKSVSASTKTPSVEDAEGLFNFKKPKDIRDGLLNGTSNILKGNSETLI